MSSAEAAPVARRSGFARALAWFGLAVIGAVPIGLALAPVWWIGFGLALLIGFGVFFSAQKWLDLAEAPLFYALPSVKRVSDGPLARRADGNLIATLAAIWSNDGDFAPELAKWSVISAAPPDLNDPKLALALGSFGALAAREDRQGVWVHALRASVAAAPDSGGAS